MCFRSDTKESLTRVALTSILRAASGVQQGWDQTELLSATTGDTAEVDANKFSRPTIKDNEIDPQLLLNVLYLNFPTDL